jgi:nucleoside-diphosphate-sugar epimerase
MGMDLARTLKERNPGLDITVLRDRSCGPYDTTAAAAAASNIPGGVSVVDAPTELMQGGFEEHTRSSSSYNYVIDNWSQNEEQAAKMVEFGRGCKVDQIVHLSPARDLYAPTEISPVTEDRALNKNCASAIVERVILSAPVSSSTVIRWMYVHGGGEGSPLLEYIVERLARGMHIPLPLHGEQLLSTTHISDLGGAISACLGEAAAGGAVINCAGRSSITYKGLCEKVRAAMHACTGTDTGSGTSEDLNYLYFEPRLFDLPTGDNEYPLGRGSCILSGAKASSLLGGWRATHDLDEGLQAEVSAILRKRETATPNPREFMHDLEIIASKDVEFTFDYDFFL